ncbi:MAG: xanthine phosphoribosyltransferase, partial [Candidatus Competibacteraceae bacterium]|nr:xanthine phosphoribosyltransferase [Candidatus Competibacteraceae bacterium]
LRISKRYLTAQDRVLLIDDFLATGSTLQALVAIVQQSGATLCGIGCVIEKPQEGGRERFSELQLPIVTLAKIALHNDSLEVFE